MLVLWMLYAVAFTAIVTGSALALEQLAAIWEVPRRVVWIAALIIAVIAPVILALRPAPAPQWMNVELDRATTSAAPALAPSRGKVIAPDRITLNVPPRFSQKWNGPIGRGWAAASIVLLALFVRGLWIVNTRRSDWEPGEVDGYPVLVADDVGPAVVGALRPKIVIPSWTLSLDRSDRALVLQHEAEHVAARDPLLLMIASLALVLVPWNAALWFIVRRLRLAVEIDCDARVVRDAASPRDYGMLLIAVGARHSAALPLAASLTERQPDLERRILAMTSLRPSRPMLASLPFAALIGLAAVAVAQTPQPAPLVPATPVAVPKVGELTTTIVPLPASEAPFVAVPKAVHLVAKPETAVVPVTNETPAGTVTALVPAEVAMRNCCEISRDTIAVWMAKYHPNVVTGGVNAETVIFVVDNEGHYVTSRVQERSLEAIAETEKRLAVEKMAISEKVSGEPLTEEQMRQLKERKVALDKAAVELRATKSDQVVISGDERRAAEEKMVQEKRNLELKGTVRLKESSALEGLNVPPESIQSVSVLKLQAGQMAPGPIGIITVFLKP